MNPSSLKLFSVLFVVIYSVCFYMEWALFRYYPETNSFYLQMHPEDGPAILWYGWLASALLLSAVIALIVPSRLAERVSSDSVWMVAVAMVVVILIYHRQWFF
jgi:hypothetical protein